MAACPACEFEVYHYLGVPHKLTSSAGCDGVDATSLSWFKISEAANDGSAWASEQITSSLNWQFTIPSSIPDG